MGKKSKRKEEKIKARQMVDSRLPPEEDDALREIFRFNAENPRFSPDVIAQARAGLIPESKLFSTRNVELRCERGAPASERERLMNESNHRIAKLTMAHMRFSIWPELYGKSNMSDECEPHYEAFYQDLINHPSYWFDVLFHESTHPKNYVHCEHATGVLGTYCTLLRQKGGRNIKRCVEVMETYTRVIEQLQKMYVVPKIVDPNLLCTVRELTYKYYMIRINLGYQIDDKAMTVKATRHVVAFETKRCNGVEPADWCESPSGDYAKLFWGKDMDAMSDREVWNVVRRLSDLNQCPDLTKLIKDFKECNMCKSRETIIEYCRGEYKSCGNCHKVFYCSKKCQKKDWPSHKKVCKVVVAKAKK